MSTPPLTSAIVTVRRKASAPTVPSSNTPTVTRISRQFSDVTPSPSTVNTPLDVIPASATAAGRSHNRRRVRPRREDDNSSSCSSTEALNHQPDDVWNDNPLYADQRRQRQRQQKMLGVRRARHVVDAGPRDDSVFVETQRADSSPPLSAAAGFKSEPALHVPDAVIIHGSATTPESDVHRGSMIDCISVAAPDDTVIKPSQLRESMRKRRTPLGSSLTDDMAVADRAPSVWRAGSLRETKRTPSIEGEMGFVRKQILSFNVSSSASVTDSELRSPEMTAKSSLSVSPSSAGPYTFSVPLTYDATQKTALQSPDKHTKTSQETDGAGTVSYEQLLDSYNQVC